VEQHKVQHRGHPHGNAHVGAVVQHVEAEIDQEDLHRDDHAVQDAGQDAGLEVLPEGPAVGRPPVTGLVTQGAQHGVVHAGQRGACKDAARDGADDHYGQIVHQEADVHQADHRQKADAGEQVCKEHAAHIAAHQLKKAAYARFAGRVLFNARPVLEIFRRRK